ncbi:hypothetical protein [Embleya sp. NPDC001921]
MSTSRPYAPIGVTYSVVVSGRKSAYRASAPSPVRAGVPPPGSGVRARA